MRTTKLMYIWAKCLGVAGTFAAVHMGVNAQQLKTRSVPLTQAEMHARVEALYDFHPSKLTDAERSKKSAEMDHFWGEAKGDTARTLPLLRVELRDAPQGSFFLTDGSELLLSLSKTSEDKQLAADALARTDLRDTQSRTYFFTVHDLACDGVNTTAAALHILDNPTFRVSVPQHAMTLDQRMALMYILLSMKDDSWVKPAAERFAVEKNVDGKIALVNAFFYEQTDSADAELRKIASDNSQPDAVRKKAQEFLNDAHKAASNWIPVMGTVAGIREQRRQRLRAVSDEAVDDVETMTGKIVQLRAKGKT
ncbi:hypothetical protein [Edaphobacter bradus]|uniref:hypothetical protein n=1 Tax=Edaphobacter bradus TaxID=2259016 RepID=UPI0021DF54FA|nr:hypothetical protein [Edaphobacter bradus]